VGTGHDPGWRAADRRQSRITTVTASRRSASRARPPTPSSRPTAPQVVGSDPRPIIEPDGLVGFRLRRGRRGRGRLPRRAEAACLSRVGWLVLFRDALQLLPRGTSTRVPTWTRRQRRDRGGGQQQLRLRHQRGVFVYGDSLDRWVATRQIWNQHTTTSPTSMMMRPCRTSRTTTGSMSA